MKFPHEVLSFSLEKRCYSHKEHAFSLIKKTAGDKIVPKFF